MVEITLGGNKVRIEGTEEFISNELDTILDRISLADSAEPSTPTEQVNNGDNSENSGADQSVDEDITDFGTSDVESLSNFDPITKVSHQLNIDRDNLENHFYIEGTKSDFNIHILDPREIPPKYALLGYCTIKEILSEETYHGNTETKKKLIDQEKVNIKDWGRVFLHNLRKEGYIKDDPNTDKKRNRPFKITPKGRNEFLDWVTENQ